MKAYRLILLLALLSCELLERGTGIGTSRWEENRSPAKNDDGSSSGTVPDTLIYVSGVSYPDSYDWQRDTSFGSVNARVLMFRGRVEGGTVKNLELALDIPAGPGTKVSADFDRHHIIGGHLYTESAGVSGTSVGVDGKFLFTYPEKEKLLGLYPEGDDIWTLGRRGSGGFSFRKNGVTVYDSGSGSVFGGFSRTGYSESGAIYRDSGKLCFAYEVVSGGKHNAYVVRDGEEKLVLSSNLRVPLDVKSIDGCDVLICNGIDGTTMTWAGRTYDIGVDGLMKWESGGVFDAEGEPMLAGVFRFINSTYSMGGVGGRSGYYNLEYGTTAISWSEGYSFGVGTVTGDGVFILCRKKDGLEYNSVTVSEPCLLLSQSCATIAGCRWFVALTPRNGGHPFVIWKSGRVELELNGFFSGVSLERKLSDS